MYAEPTKKCIKCGEVLPLSAYHARSDRPDGKQYKCKKCDNADKRKWKEKNPARRLFDNCKMHAERRGLLFALPREWFDKKLEDGKCEVTGLPFVYGHRHPCRPSPDQIIPGGGYVDGNTRMVLWMINAAKGTCSEEEFRVLLRQVAEAVVEQG